MNNKEFLEAMGFYEHAGWMHCAHVSNTGVFKVGCFEQMSKDLIGKIIAQTAFKAGTKYQHEKMQRNIEVEMKNMLTKLDKNAHR